MVASNLPKWHVLPNGQRLTTVLSPTGPGFQDVWEVTYQVDDGPAVGTQGQVNVPASQHNAAVVRAAIEAQLQNVHAVAGLGNV